ERDLARVDHDDEVAGIDMRGEARLVLAADEVRDLRHRAPEGETGDIDHVPLAIVLRGLLREELRLCHGFLKTLQRGRLIGGTPQGVKDITWRRSAGLR